MLPGFPDFSGNCRDCQQTPLAAVWRHTPELPRQLTQTHVNVAGHEMQSPDIVCENLDAAGSMGCFRHGLIVDGVVKMATNTS
jgi:hypothetical protein